MEKKQYSALSKEIKSRRLKLRLDDIFVAHQARLSIHEYYDIEAYSDELFSVVPLYHVKKICGILKLDFLSLFDIPCVFCNKATPHIEDYWLNRASLVHKKRIAMNLSEKDLANMVGFDEKEIKYIETYSAHLESWVIDNVIKLAEQIDIPPQILLDVQCSKCRN